MTGDHSIDRRHAALLAAIVLGGTLLRLRYLDVPMRYDEAFTFDAYTLSGVGHITSTYDIPNNHIFYTLLTNFTWRLFGDHLWTVRLPALLAGIALIPMSYLVARTLYDRRAGLCAAVLIATFGPLVDYSVNGRGYTLGALLMLIMLWLAAKLLRDSRPLMWAAFVTCSTLAIYTVPTMAYGVAVVAAWMAACAVWETRAVRLVAQLGLACALVAGLSLLLYSPVLGQAGWTAVDPVPVNWSPIAHLATRVWEHWNSDAPHPLDWVVAACFLAATFLHRRIAQHPVPLVAAAAVITLAIVAFGKLPPYPRSWLFLLPLYLIPAGAGISWLTSRARVPALPDGAVTALATAFVAVPLALATLSSELRNTDTPPTSDNNIVELLRRFVPPHQRAAMDPVFVAVPSAYYFRRFGGSELVSSHIGPAERRAGHVILVVARDVPPEEAVRFFGVRSTRPARRLFHRYIDIYDVPIAHR
jgi:uncharacterized membrane protein